MDIARRWFPIPLSFAEINVRTYVTYEGKPGVWFFSLDATDILAVWTARRFLRPAVPPLRDQDGAPGRPHPLGREARRTARPALSPSTAPPVRRRRRQPNTLEHFLTERYCLYAVSRRGDLTRTEVHHVPWPLQPAHATIRHNTMAAPAGIDLPDDLPITHFAKHIDVVTWSPERLTSPSRAPAS